MSADNKLGEKYGHEKTHMFNHVTRTRPEFTFNMQRTDQAIPMDLTAWTQWCVEWVSRPFPIPSPYQIDDEESFYFIDDGENEAVHGLIGVATI